MKTTIPALFLAAACASFTAFAASPTDAPKAAEAQAAHAEPTKVQAHSHLQEKTGIMPNKKSAKARPEEEKGDIPAAAEDKSAAAAQSKSSGATRGKVKADKDKSKHFHPRDGK